MFRLYLSITWVILSSAMDHITQQQIHAGVNFAVSIIVSFLVSMILWLVLLQFLPPELGFRIALKQLNWTSHVLAFSLVGLILLNWKR